MSYGGYGGHQQQQPYGGGYGGAPPAGYGPPAGAPPGYGGGVAHGYGHGPGPGGFAPPAAAGGPPPGADPQLWNWFTAVDTDRSGHITAVELEQALINGDWSRFDLDTVKLLMTIFDTDRSGTIGFNEFAGLWQYIKEWQAVFKHFDQDNSGSIDKRELSNALAQFGFTLSPQLLNLVEKKYDVKASAPTPAAGYGGGYGGPPPGITFDRFVRACVVIKTLTESFRRLDTDNDRMIHINYEQFMQTVLSAP